MAIFLVTDIGQSLATLSKDILSLFLPRMRPFALWSGILSMSPTGVST